MKVVFGKATDIVEKGENAGYHNFKSFLPKEHENTGVFGNGLALSQQYHFLTLYLTFSIFN